MRTDKLGVLAEGRVRHLRLWAENASSDEVLRSLLEGLGLSAPVHLEFWDSKCPAGETLSALDLLVEQPSEGLRFAWNVGVKHLPTILEKVQDCSFGAWFGVDRATAEQAGRERSNRKRAESLPSGGAFVIFSLYDENVEVFATGTGEAH